MRTRPGWAQVGQVDGWRPVDGSEIRLLMAPPVVEVFNWDKLPTSTGDQPWPQSELPGNSGHSSGGCYVEAIGKTHRDYSVFPGGLQ